MVLFVEVMHFRVGVDGKVSGVVQFYVNKLTKFV